MVDSTLFVNEGDTLTLFDPASFVPVPGFSVQFTIQSVDPSDVPVEDVALQAQDFTLTGGGTFTDINLRTVTLDIINDALEEGDEVLDILTTVLTTDESSGDSFDVNILTRYIIRANDGGTGSNDPEPPGQLNYFLDADLPTDPIPGQFAWNEDVAGEVVRSPSIEFDTGLGGYVLDGYIPGQAGSDWGIAEGLGALRDQAREDIIGRGYGIFMSSAQDFFNDLGGRFGASTLGDTITNLADFGRDIYTYHTGVLDELATAIENFESLSLNAVGNLNSRIDNLSSNFLTSVQDNVPAPLSNAIESMRLGVFETNSFELGVDISTQVIGGGNISDGIAGGSLDDVLDGLGGSDVLAGRGGSDVLLGGTGTDILLGGDGDDGIYGDASVRSGSPLNLVLPPLFALDTTIIGPSIFDTPASALDLTTRGFSIRPDAEIGDATIIPHHTVAVSQGSGIYYFTIEITNPGVEITLDIDHGDETGSNSSDVDTFIRLLDSGQNTVAENDDSATSAGAGGSDTTLDSFLQHTFTTTGTFYIAVGAFPNLAPISGSASFDLQISVEGEIFGPAASGQGNDILLGGLGNDRIFGEGGNDILNGGPGDDFINGGAGRDTVNYVGTPGPVQVNLFSGTVTGAAGSDSLRQIEDIQSGNGTDMLIGNNGPNRIVAANGNDNLQGLAHNDELFGQGGNDTLLGGPGNDLLNGGAGSDTVSFLISPNPVVVRLLAGTANGEGTDTLQGIENAIGSNLGDTIIGNLGANNIQGQNGNDTLNGAAGNDRLVAGNQNDNLNGANGDDELFGQENDDTLIGGFGNDLLNGGNGIDTYQIGQPGGAVAVNLSSGNATGAAGSDTLVSIENIIGSNGSDSYTGSSANNRITGANGNDTISGLGGADELFGQNGNDILNGGAGNDILNGGFGADTFIVRNGTGDDTIQGFKGFTDQGNRLDVSDFAGILNFSDLINNHAATQGTDVLITLDADDSVLLDEVTLGELEANDFIF